MVTQRLQDVVALGKIFQFPLAAGIGAKNETEEKEKPVKVEVDIVANGGSAWFK